MRSLVTKRGVKVVKNKVAPPFRQAEFQILYGKGIYRTGEIIDLGVQLGLLEKSRRFGTAIRALKLAKVKSQLSTLLRRNPELCQSLEQQIRDQLLMPGPNAKKPVDASH